MSGTAEVQAVRDEAKELLALVAPFDADTWWRPTPFKGWSAFDVIVHLHEADRMGLVSATDPAAFRRQQQERRSAPPRPDGELPRERVAVREPAALLSLWQDTLERLCAALDQRDPDDKLPWGGPDMAVGRFAAARLMEIWAHGQDIYDLLRQPRRHAERIRFIADLGVRTFRWTFSNRGLDCPEVRPYVQLTSPAGESWSWNEMNATECVTGSAVDFCQVVTQVRNVADTRLQVRGEAATRWMALAQCFAGVPRDPPAKGTRTWSPA